MCGSTTVVNTRRSRTYSAAAPSSSSSFVVAAKSKGGTIISVSTRAILLRCTATLLLLLLCPSSVTAFLLQPADLLRTTTARTRSAAMENHSKNNNANKRPRYSSSDHQQQQRQHRSLLLKASSSSSSSSSLSATEEEQSTTQTGGGTSATTTTTTTNELTAAATASAGEEAAPAADDDASAADASAASFVEPDTHEELLYALGVNLARQLGDVRPLVNTGDELAAVARGLLDAVVGRLSDAGQRGLLSRRGTELNRLIAERADNIRRQLEDAGREMLRTMAETDGVRVLDSGVAVHVLESKPDGARPTRASTVKIHYHGTLADGTVFDSTLAAAAAAAAAAEAEDSGRDDDKVTNKNKKTKAAAGEPVTLPLGGAIAGFRDGLLKLREGETAMIGIPPERAYGDAGTPDGRIPAGSSLFFKVQLVEVLTAGIGGAPTLVGADGRKLASPAGGDDSSKGSSGLLGADGRPL